MSKLYRSLRLPPQDSYHMVLHVRDAERYSTILKALDDAVAENQNTEWIQYRSILLEEKTVFEICFLEDVLSITNVLCLVLQTDKKDFGAQELFQTALRYLKKSLLIRTLIWLKV